MISYIFLSETWYKYYSIRTISKHRCRSSET